MGADLGPIWRTGWVPGAIGAVAALHGRYYAAAWNFGVRFEADVAGELSDFLVSAHPKRDLFLSVWHEDTLIGSVTLDATRTGPAAGERAARVRWFITDERARGTGLGRKLLAEALAFADANGCDPVWLTTFAGLDAARHLYEAHGFRLTGEAATDHWHGGVGEQRFERTRPR